ncbi:acyl-ACP--UDP-N-acetylglucosamine O-acyltransferase [soil metagenome]
MIHPTALIDPAAEFADDCQVGPFSICEGGARIARGCRIGAAAQLVGAVHLGAGTTVGRAAVIGTDPQDVSFDPATPSGVRIGERNTIREHATIHRSIRPGEFTTLGSDNFLMVGCHLGHDVVLGDHNGFANACLLAGFVTVGDRAFLGGGAVFHQFVRVGDGVMVQGNASLSRDVPPFCVVSGLNGLKGLNVVGLRRAGFSADERAELKRLYVLLFGSGRNLGQAVTEASRHPWSPRSRPLLDFVAAPSRKGVCLA